MIFEPYWRGMFFGVLLGAEITLGVLWAIGVLR